MNHKTTLVTALAAISLSLSAQSDRAPQFINPSPGSSVVVTNMSNNGKWMISETAGNVEGSIAPGGGMLINIDNPALKYTISHTSGLAGVGDVTDDGTMVVGECTSKPAYWLTAVQEWTILPLPEGYLWGRLNTVTPDGKFAAGMAGKEDEWSFYPIFYDLTTKTLIELPGLPNRDMTNQDQGQNAITAISPDGRYILGNISQSYIMPTALCSYVYDRQTATYDFIGFTEPATATGKWQSKADGMLFVDSPAMSPNGEWVAGSAHMVKDVSGSDFGREYDVAFRYNVKSKEFEVFDGQYDSDIAAFSITNDGVVYAATPAVNPYSSMVVRHGNYYYNLDQILKQVYNIDYEAKTGYAVTGKPVCVSDDGLTIAMLPSTTDTYILRLQEPLSEICENIDLLGDYSVTPAAGSVFTQLRSISINFGRPVALAGNATNITVTNGEGTTARALSASVEASTLTVNFRTLDMTPGKTYTVEIPAGMVSINGDRNIRNRKITVAYTGRNEGPVKPISVYPADGNTFARLDMSTNPILVTFDAQVNAVSNAKGRLCSVDGNDETFICDLNIACGGTQMMVYPTVGQYLFKDINYRVIIPANSATDISGAGANEEIVYNYVGAYVREAPVGNRYLFQDDCSSYDNFLLYDGDKRQPVTAIANWGFNAESTPWWFTREDENSSDMALASHSMYNPAGQSDDWMSTVQIYLPDNNCVLTFDSQSYKADKQDYLKVYVLATDDIFAVLNASIAERFRTQGKLVYNELQSPGADEEKLVGDWRHNVVDLAEFAGKNLYIAFVNDNNDQSVVFVDNITVLRDTKFVASFDTPERLVNRESIAIKGNIDITSELETYSSIELTLKDSDGKVVDTIKESGLTLKNKDTYPFTFAKELTLRKGVENSFSLEVKLDDESTTLSSSIKNLTFEPDHKILLEEFTGQGCPNCPRGILAIENLQRIYGDKVIPVALHCYTGDELGSGLHSYASFLGLNGAPSATINRGEITAPMLAVNGNWSFTAGGEGNDYNNLSWLDMAQREFEKQADAQISITSAYNEDTKQFTVDCTVKSALNQTGSNVNLLAFVTEDNILTYQSNNNAGFENPELGDWGKGGKYGQSTVYPYYAQHVARAVYGTTFNGTGGYIPQNIESDKEYSASLTLPLPSTVNVPDNCHVVVAMVDGNTGRIINADHVSLTGHSGLESVVTDRNLDARVTVLPSMLEIAAEGDFTVEVYTLAGRLAAIATGNGSVEVPVDGFTGPAVVRVTSANAASVVKVILK